MVGVTDDLADDAEVADLRNRVALLVHLLVEEGTRRNREVPLVVLGAEEESERWDDVCQGITVIGERAVAVAGVAGQAGARVVSLDVLDELLEVSEGCSDVGVAGVDNSG